MQGRSWMAALTLAVWTALAAAQGARAEDRVVVKEVELKIAIAGLSESGCDIEVKPGHAGCAFQRVTKHVDQAGQLSVFLKNVETRSADHDCAFAIKIKEPGFPDRTVHRGLRLAPPTDNKLAAKPYLNCYISSPSKLARAESVRTRR